MMKKTSSSSRPPAGHLKTPRNISTQRSVSEGFIARVCCIDAQGGRKVCGLVEVLDGSGETGPLTRVDEPGEILKAPRSG